MKRNPWYVEWIINPQEHQLTQGYFSLGSTLVLLIVFLDCSNFTLRLQEGCGCHAEKHPTGPSHKLVLYAQAQAFEKKSDSHPNNLGWEAWDVEVIWQQRSTKVGHKTDSKTDSAIFRGGTMDPNHGKSPLSHRGPLIPHPWFPAFAEFPWQHPSTIIFIYHCEPLHLPSPRAAGARKMVIRWFWRARGFRF